MFTSTSFLPFHSVSFRKNDFSEKVGISRNDHIIPLFCPRMEVTLHYKEFIAENHHHYTVPINDIHFIFFQESKISAATPP